MGFWGVFDMSFWRSAAVMAFSDYIDATALAYTNRLGEQVSSLAEGLTHK
jgi:hypothetical protein